MRFGYRGFVSVMLLVAGLGAASMGCSQTTSKATQPIVTVYATPT